MKAMNLPYLLKVGITSVICTTWAITTYISWLKGTPDLNTISIHATISATGIYFVMAYFFDWSMHWGPFRILPLNTDNSDKNHIERVLGLITGITVFLIGIWLLLRSDV